MGNPAHLGGVMYLPTYLTAAQSLPDCQPSHLSPII